MEQSNKTYSQKRKAFLDYWSSRLPCKSEMIKGEYFNKNLYHCLKLCEMHLIDGKVSSTYDEEYCYFNKYWNTRYLFPQEFCLEFDIDHETAVRACAGVIVNLIEEDYSFAVWYAEGMRSPHIRIYNLLPDDEKFSSQDLAMLRAKFAQIITPIEYQKYIDKSLFKRHKIPLEYSFHWKYGTRFNLLFKHQAEEKS